MSAISLQIFSIAGIVTYFLLMLYFLKQKSLSLKYTLIWIFWGLCMMIVAIFPSVLTFVSDILGIQMPVNALFAILFFFILNIMMTLTAIVSRQGNRIKALAQSNALLDKRVRDLEFILEDKKTNL